MLFRKRDRMKPFKFRSFLPKAFLETLIAFGRDERKTSPSLFLNAELHVQTTWIPGLIGDMVCNPQNYSCLLHELPLPLLAHPLCNNNSRTVITFGLTNNTVEMLLEKEVFPVLTFLQELCSHVVSGNFSGNHIPFLVPIQQPDLFPALSNSQASSLQGMNGGGKRKWRDKKKCWGLIFRSRLYLRRNLLTKGHALTFHFGRWALAAFCFKLW